MPCFFNETIDVLPLHYDASSQEFAERTLSTDDVATSP